jgi:hypothetical protein
MTTHEGLWGEWITYLETISLATSHKPLQSFTLRSPLNSKDESQLMNRMLALRSNQNGRDGKETFLGNICID